MKAELALEFKRTTTKKVFMDKEQLSTLYLIKAEALRIERRLEEKKELLQMVMEPIKFLTPTKSTKYLTILNKRTKWRQLDREFQLKQTTKLLR